MVLETKSFKDEYRTGHGDPIADFLIPALGASTEYLRAAGYFSSSIYALIGDDAIEFFAKGGRCRIVCSPNLSKEDADALGKAIAEPKAVVASSLIQEFKAISESKGTLDPLSFLATVVAADFAQIKIAYRPGYRGIFHEKLGVFIDEVGQAVSFKGSSNETLSAWHPQGNFESFEVFKSFGESTDAKRCLRHKKYFERLWANEINGVSVISFPDAAKRELIQYRTQKYEKALSGDSHRKKYSRPSSIEKIDLYRHQKQALLSWKNRNYRGILKHATGSGKTITALAAINEHIKNGHPAVVLVPAIILLEQWRTEIKKLIEQADLLCIGGPYSKWRTRPGLLRSFLEDDPSLGQRVVLSTIQSYVRNQLWKNIAESNQALFVIDECHQAGSKTGRNCLNTPARKRLGLSATPERFGDEEGTDAILSFFSGVVDPEYTLEHALEDGRLTPYKYFPSFVTLDSIEREQWAELTRKIRQLFAMKSSQQDDDGQAFLQNLILRRARIAKKASKKEQVALNILKENFSSGDRWLVYCEDGDQLAALRARLRVAGLPNDEYRQDMTGDPKATLDSFEAFDGILLAIRCLDEGVDIPVVDHALILASSQNPRQFIQRRGRVLRTAPGKTVAEIHDVLVRTPDPSDDSLASSYFASEFSRAKEFAKLALNCDSCELRLMRMAIEDGLDLESSTNLIESLEDSDDVND